MAEDIKLSSYDRPKVAIVGSRIIPKLSETSEYLNLLIDFLCGAHHDDIEIVSGGAIGIDSIAENWCIEKEIPFIKFLPEYDKFENKKLAPLARNSTIAEYADVCIAFQNKNSRGTADVISKFQKLGKKCIVIDLETLKEKK